MKNEDIWNIFCNFFLFPLHRITKKFWIQQHRKLKTQKREHSIRDTKYFKQTNHEVPRTKFFIIIIIHIFSLTHSLTLCHSSHIFQLKESEEFVIPSFIPVQHNAQVRKNSSYKRRYCRLTHTHTKLKWVHWRENSHLPVYQH